MFPLYMRRYTFKTSERLHTISIFLAGGEGFYYSSQRENSQETKYINFRVTK